MTYIAYRNDRLSTPLFVTDSLSEMAEFLGMTKDSAIAKISKQRKKGYRISREDAVLVYRYDFEGGEKP